MNAIIRGTSSRSYLETQGNPACLMSFKDEFTRVVQGIIIQIEANKNCPIRSSASIRAAMVAFTLAEIRVAFDRSHYARDVVSEFNKEMRAMRESIRSEPSLIRNVIDDKGPQKILLQISGHDKSDDFANAGAVLEMVEALGLKILRASGYGAKQNTIPTLRINA